MAEDNRERHFQGIISFEKDIKTGIMRGDIGIQTSKGGRVWICLNGEALIRLNPFPAGGEQNAI